MPNIGQDIIDIGSVKVGQKYVLGADVPLDNPNWNGPWDCAEFASWAVYQAYDGLVFGAGRPSNVAKAEPYSGFWYREARKYATAISWEEALKIPGAILIRAPATSGIGHVAISMGDDDRTLEARGKNFGVGIFSGAKKRPWGIGCLLPGIEYSGMDPIPLTDAEKRKHLDLPPGYFWLKWPNFKGADILVIQKALQKAGIDPGPLDGVFGPMTDAAVTSFQASKGLEFDGIFGPSTSKALGLGFPVVPSSAEIADYENIQAGTGPGAISLPKSPAGFDGIAAIKKSGKTYRATTDSGFEFIVGTSTNYTDDMHRTGLFQGSTAIKDSLKFGTYKASDFVGTFQNWAFFIEPTLNAEGGARFATLNTYDRAAFTFGAPQLAAHTPNANFVVYLRELLTLPDASRHFPELSLRKNNHGDTTVHLEKSGAFVDLEQAIKVTRPNGKKEIQIPKLMSYLNSSPVKVDDAELTAAARLMNWLRLDVRAKELQIRIFIGHAKQNIAAAKQKVPGFNGTDWRTALWVMDIRHQGRGSYFQMKQAFASSNPENALKSIGSGSYSSRIKTVAKAIDKLDASGVLNGFTV